MRFNNVDEAYKGLCKALVCAPAVGNTRELTNVTVEIDNITDSIVSIRDISLSYLFGELLWYFNGSRSMRYISKFSSFWKGISDDGMTSNSAYGYILERKHGFNQTNKIVGLLTQDPNSRRAVLNINVPNEKVIETKDEPCTIALQFLIRDGKLHCTTMMRSNDIWFGTPYDWAFFIEVQKVIADRLGLAYGTYTHFVTSLHVYERNMKEVEKIAVSHMGELCNRVLFDREKFHEYKEVLFALTENMDAKVAKDVLDATGIIKHQFGGKQ